MEGYTTMATYNTGDRVLVTEPKSVHNGKVGVVAHVGMTPDGKVFYRVDGLAKRLPIFLPEQLSPAPAKPETQVSELGLLAAQLFLSTAPSRT